jgi:hypothetical protein
MSLQYDPVTHQKWFAAANGQILNGYTSNFTKGCVAAAGGEVYADVEDMGNTRFSYLGWSKIASDGIIRFKYWAKNKERIADGRYSCTVVTPIEHRCGP